MSQKASTPPNSCTSFPSKSYKTGFPPNVLKFKEYLEHSGDPWAITMRKLTEQKKNLDISALQKMWRTLEEKEQKKYNTLDDTWVRYFVMYASFYSHLPPYYFEPKSQRNLLTQDLRQLVKKLTRALQYNEFDYRISSLNKNENFLFYEELGYSDRREIDNSQAVIPKISDVLNKILNMAENEIKSTVTVRKDLHAQARMFVYYMANYLRNIYGSPLYSVLITTAIAIFGIQYDEREIRKIIETTKIKTCAPKPKDAPRIEDDDLF